MNSVRRYIYVKDSVKLCYQSMQKKFDNKYLILTGQKKIKAEFLFKILAKLFKSSKKEY